MEIRQKAIETCITAMLLDLSRYFRCHASIQNTGDARYWEDRLRYTDKQFTENTDNMTVSFNNNISVENDQNTAPTNIDFMYVDENEDIKHLLINVKRRTISFSMGCKIEANNMIDAMNRTEELIDKAASARTFSYFIFGKQFKANYKISSDFSNTSRTEFDYSSDQGFVIEFPLLVEMQYYAPTYKSSNMTPIVTQQQKVKRLVGTGVFVPSADNENEEVEVFSEIEETIDVLVRQDANISEFSDGVISKLFHNTIVKE